MPSSSPVRILGEYRGANRVGYAEDLGDGARVEVTRNYTSGVPSIEGIYRYDDYGPRLVRELPAGRTVVRADIANDPLLTQTEKQAHAALQLGATVNVPLIKDGGLTAILFLHYREAHAFTEREIRLLESTAERTWSAVQHARSENALRESERRFQFITERAQIGYWDWNIVSGELDWSPICKRLFGIPQEETMSYEKFLAAIHPDDRERTCRAVSACLESVGSADYDIEYRSLWPDSTTHWIRAKGSAIFDGDKPLRMAGVAIDIEQHKKYEEALRRRVNEDLEQFSYSASHDLQEPLRTISLYCQMLARRHKDRLGSDGVRLVDTIYKGTTRMAHLLSDLLSYTRITKLEEPAESVDVGAVVATTLIALQAAVQETEAKICVEGRLPTMPVHEMHLTQLFQNLIGNALRYRHPLRPPIVSVSARRANAQWLFEVADNGVGIDPEHTEKVFGLFKRLHTDERYPGTGIGLTLCKRIVELYGGRIWIESAPGNGATFYFTLPL